MDEKNLKKAKELLETGEASINDIQEILLHAEVDPKEVNDIISELEKDESGKKKGLLEKYKAELRKGRSLNEIDSMLKKEEITKDLRIELLKELETFKQELENQPAAGSTGSGRSPDAGESSEKKHKWIIYAVVGLAIAAVLFFIYSAVKD